MKILLIGILALLGWSALSTHIYVCNIRGLCADPLTRQITTISQNLVITTDSSVKLTGIGKSIIPDSIQIHFEFDKSEFNPEALSDKYFIESMGFLNNNPGARLTITGFADATGSVEYNQALGYRRAMSLGSYFEGRGMNASKIIIGSKGEGYPVDDNNSISGRANNRRALLTLKN